MSPRPTVILLAGVLSACAPDVTIESPPDVTELQASLAAPTGLATAEAIMAALEAFESSPTALLQQNLAAVPEEVKKFEDLRQGQEQPPLELGDLALEATGSGHFESPCDVAEGFESARFSMSFAFTQDGLNPAIWGEIRGCEEITTIQGESLALGLDGTFQLVLVDQEGFEPNLENVLVQFAGKFFHLGSEIFDGQLQARLQDDKTTYQFPLEDGTYLLHTFNRDLTYHQFQDVDGTFTCDLALESCESPDGTSFAL